MSRYLKVISCLFLLPFILLLHGCSDNSDYQNTDTIKWYSDAVNYCNKNGLLIDFLQDDAHLTDCVSWSTLTKALSQFVNNYSEELYTSDSNYDDLSAAMCWAYDFGLINREVSEVDVVSRFDVADVLFAFLSKSNVITNPTLSNSRFKDFPSIPTDHQQNVLFVESNNLMNGYDDGSFRGDDSLTICQLAQILYNGKNLFSNVSMNKIFSINENDITSIVLQNGSTGDKESIIDSNKISEIVNHLNSFEFDTMRKIDSEGWEGWTWRFTLCFSSGESFSFYATSKSVTIDNISYESNITYFPTL